MPQTKLPSLFPSSIVSLLILLISCSQPAEKKETFKPSFKLIPSEKFFFNSFVDCNMAEVWIKDTFRIFPGKYGEDPVWGYATELEFADGRNADEAFSSKADKFTRPVMPPNAPIGQKGLHGAVWFETVYQDVRDTSEKTLYALYHNENYPATLPYDSVSGEGYIDYKWPQGLKGPSSAAAVCRIGIMKSTDGGRSWENKGIILEDLQARMILKPHNTSVTFAGGVGDPSAVASGDYLYIFYGEYGYPGVYDEVKYSDSTEWTGQCISIARIPLADLDNPFDKAKRWDGKDFTIPYNGIGQPVKSLQIPREQGGNAASSAKTAFHWGPSVSWNSYLDCWVMLMGKVTGPSWQGSSLYISFNKNKDLGAALQSQEWTTPELLIDKPGHILWYPSLQPMNTEDDIKNRRTCLKLGQKARFFFKDMEGPKNEYSSSFIVEFNK
jgi:hypothetical protein